MIIGVVGLGLLGGSLAKSLKNKSDITKIIAYNRNKKSLMQGFQDGYIDVIADEIDENFQTCDYIFVCMPVSLIIPTVEKLTSIVNEDCIITDVGSTKEEITNYFLNKNPNFIGGHPMAGSEKTGYTAADEYLFENAFYLLTPTDNTDIEKVFNLEKLIKKMGAIPVIIDAKKHDHIVAAISHLPHILASTLVNTVLDCDDDNKNMHLLAAGGFKDITRIASGDPLMWENICSENRAEIIKLINLFKIQLQKFENSINNKENENVFDLFECAKKYRDSFATNHSKSILKSPELYLDIVDKPGIIAEIATILANENINMKNIGINNNREHQQGVLQIIFEDEKEKTKSVSILQKLGFKVFIH